MQEMTRKENPRFLAFKEEAARALAAFPALMRLDCLNPIKAIAHTFDVSSVGVDIDIAWERYLGHEIRHRFHSRGVRDSLLMLFQWLAEEGRSITLPCDVYPVYRRLAVKAGLTFATYSTLPEFDLASILATSGNALLVTAPLSPLGRDLTSDEVDALEAWLRERSDRFLVVDRVYDYGSGVDLRRLIATEQATVCWSLSKSFLSPLIMGFTAVPEHLERLQGEQPDFEKASAILTRHRGFPGEQSSIFQYRWRKLTPLLSSLDTSWRRPETGYLSILRMRHTELLSHGILAVPGSVYETDDEFSVLTCLHESLAFDDSKLVPRYHATVLPNFARAYEKYSRTYDKRHIPESHFPNQFHLLKEAELNIGIGKAERLRHQTGGGRIIVLQTSVPNHALRPNERTGLGEWIQGGRIEVEGVYDERLNRLGIEEVYADSLEAIGGLRAWHEVVPRHFRSCRSPTLVRRTAPSASRTLQFQRTNLRGD